MRNISFSLTEQQFLDGTKDVTRRLGWAFLKPGDRLMACRKCMGLKPGEKIVRLGEIEVVSVRREKLNSMSRYWEIAERRIGYGATEAIREGFDGMTGDQFVTMFCKHMKCRPDTFVTRIVFKRICGERCWWCGRDLRGDEIPAGWCDHCGSVMSEPAPNRQPAPATTERSEA